MQLYIDAIDRSKTINTQYGSKVKVGVKSRGKWYSCLSASWNNAWKEGDTIDVETQEKHVNGKVYVNITGLSNGAVVKSSSNNSNPQQSNKSLDVLISIDDKLSKLLTLLSNKKELSEATKKDPQLNSVAKVFPESKVMNTFDDEEIPF